MLEKSSGRQLSEVWDDLKESEQSDLIRNFAELESKLATVDFPGYGALYLRDGLPHALPNGHRTIQVDDTYCLGPMYHDSWPGGYAADPEQYAEYSGPCKPSSTCRYRQDLT